MPGLSLRGLQLTLLAAALASALILSGALPEPAALACLFAVTVATAVSSGERRRPGGGWWALLAAGTALSITGALLAQLSDGLGGVIAVLGAVTVIIGAVIGFPLAGAPDG